MNEFEFARRNSDDPEAEYYSRQLAQRSLIDFTTYTYPRYQPENFHIQVSEHLDKIVSGDIERLMIFAPPQHGKSELTSVRLPAFWFAKQPGQPVLLASYGATLAWEKAASVLDIVYSEDYRRLFPHLFTTAPKMRRGGRSNILKDRNSKIYACGTMGAITGRGGLLGIIDDPVKDWQSAYSQNNRDKVWAWWKGTFRSRIWNKGRILIIMTRWHDDDLAGRILNQSGEKWTVLRYPAIAESEEERGANKKYLGRAIELFSGDPLDRLPGDPLCPIRYPIHALLDIQHDVGPRPWAAEYQGTPKPIEGNRIKMDHIHTVDEWPRGETVKLIRYWDKAGSEDSGARTAGVLLAATRDKTWYVVDMVKGQWSPFKREEVMKETAKKDEDLYNGKVESWFEIEPGSEGKFGAAFTMKNMAGLNIRPDRPSAGKEVRFEVVANQFEAGNIYLVKGPWTWEFVDELLMFPHGVFKDQVDALSGAFKKSITAGWSRGPGGTA